MVLINKKSTILRPNEYVSNGSITAVLDCLPIGFALAELNFCEGGAPKDTFLPLSTCALEVAEGPWKTGPVALDPDSRGASTWFTGSRLDLQFQTQFSKG
jgi:hypothetical protein